MSTTPDGTVHRVAAAVRRIVSEICDIPIDELTDDQQIAYLDIDSVFAAEIVVRIEKDLNVDIDIRRILDDWSGLTLRGLAVQISSGVER